MSDLMSIQDAVREDVKLSIMKVLPPEVVDKVVKEIFETEIKKQIENAFREEYRNQLKVKISDLICRQYQDTISEDVQVLAKKAGNEFMKGFTESLLHEALNRMQNNY